MARIVKNERWLEEHARRLHRESMILMVKIEQATKQRISRTQTRKRSGSGYRGLDPSRPGEPPKVLTGRLRRSIKGLARRNRKGVLLRLSARTPYARRLELSEAEGGMDRPYLRTTIKAHRPEIRKMLKRVF